MNANAVGRGAAHHVARFDRRPSPGPSVATTTTTASVDTGGSVAVADEAGDESAAGATTPGGNDTPFTHALHRGSGAKVGIHRRMAEWIATQQAEAGLSGTPVGIDGDQARSTDAVTVGETVTGSEPQVEGETDAEGQSAAADASGEVGATPDAPVAGDAAAPTGAIAIDGSTLLDTGLRSMEDAPTPLEQLMEAVADDDEVVTSLDRVETHQVTTLAAEA